jgi:2-polyprenyl-3-methyl-5-hydroxy-6-metoxy-1,4-benzoquinol methylase
MQNSSSDISEQVKRQMNRPQIHESWEKTYRTKGNEQFFEQAYDDIAKRLAQKPNSLALDIGCGIGANSIRLARRDYIVSAADYSEPILEQARENITNQKLSDRITLGREDILKLSFPSKHFDLVLCWGVLMHVPNAERAIGELIRVAKPGAFLVLEEINQRAPEAWMMRMGWSALKKGIVITETQRGYEQTSRFENETLFWRHTNTRWLIDQFARHSCKLIRRDSGMISDMYMYAPGARFKEVINAWNRWSTRHINLPQLALHNIFIFRKNSG